MSSRPAERKAAPKLLVALFYLFLPALKPILKRTLRRNRRIWSRLQAARDGVVQSSPPPFGMEAPFTRRLYASASYLFGPVSRALAGPRQRASRLFGVNVAGYFSSPTGTGEAARSAVRLLEAANIPCALNNVIGPGSVIKDSAYSDFSKANPYALNLIYVNPDQAANFVWNKGEAYFRGRYNIGVWNWEMPDFPQEWLSRFRYYDEIWVATNFVAGAISPVSPVPVLRMAYAIDPEPKGGDGLDRSVLGLSADTFLFLFVFDFHSIFERKNPLGLIQAFGRAFSRDEPVALVVKSSHADDEAVRKMREAAEQANVKIVNTALSREEMNALYSLCHCYVSLHRSEGFGLTLAEAMTAGKPVIATAYGGNTDFMTSQNSYLVQYKLVEIDRDHGPYQRGWVWADPDIDHAAQLMRHVYENRQEALKVGRKGRADILRLLHPKVVGNLMRQRLLTIASLQGIAVPDQKMPANGPLPEGAREATPSN